MSMGGRSMRRWLGVGLVVAGTFVGLGSVSSCGGDDDRMEGPCTAASECDDDVVCTEDECIGGSCTHRVMRSRCGGDESCDPRRGCVRGGICGTDDDCADDDPCTTNEGCAPSSRTCVWRFLDGDSDGFPPLVCG